jgi:peptidyl-dipeptidase Dcp
MSQSYGRQKTKLREIDKELSKTSLQFGENVLAETQAFQMHLTDRLIWLTRRHDRSRSFFHEKSRKRRLDFTLDYPSYVPFVTYADNRELRKRWYCF